jgi:hypothetical protein
MSRIVLRTTTDASKFLKSHKVYTLSAGSPRGEFLRPFDPNKKAARGINPQAATRVFWLSLNYKV